MAERDVLRPPREGDCVRCGRHLPAPPDGGWVWNGSSLICPDCLSNDEGETFIAQIKLVKEDDA